MNTLSKSLIVATIVGTVGAGTLATDAIANAESGTSTSTSPVSSLVDKLASTFNLDKTNVQEVFDSQRTEMETARAQRVSDRLDALVTAGTITSAQKSAIETKLAELKKEREANKDDMKDMSDEERKSKMDEKRTEMESWAKEQGLDLSKLKGVFGGPGGRGGPGGPR